MARVTENPDPAAEYAAKRDAHPAMEPHRMTLGVFALPVNDQTLGVALDCAVVG